MSNKKSKPSAQPAANTPNEKSITTKMSKLAINRRAPSMSSDASVGVLVEVPRCGQRDIVAEFSAYFGDETRLQNWQRMCQDVGIEGDLLSITKCKKALKKIWVNIYDLVDARNTNKLPVRRFQNQNALIQYTLSHRKIYPKKEAKKNGPVRALLRHIFRN